MYMAWKVDGRGLHSNYVLPGSLRCVLGADDSEYAGRRVFERNERGVVIIGHRFCLSIYKKTAMTLKSSMPLA